MKSSFIQFTSAEERRIARHLLAEIFSDPSNCVTVNDGGEENYGPFFSARGVEEALASTGSDWITVYGANAQRLGSIWLIWGNGEDLISDYSDNPWTQSLIERVS